MTAAADERAGATWRAGPWRLRGDPELFAVVRAELERDAEDGARVGAVRELGGLRVHHKGSPLAVRPALRHGLRSALGIAAVPRLQELENLAWLRAHGFLAVRPLLAGARYAAGLPRYQFLVTELMAGAPTLAELCVAGPDARRAPALRALAIDLARLHALGFVHRDLFPRNLLVVGAADAVRCAFLDAWRGTPRPGRRPPEHDLGCLLLDGARLLDAEEQALFLSTYREARANAGRPTGAGWERRVERARAAVLAREIRRRPDCAREWRFPA